MKTITEGHKYELANFENVEAAGQTIQFIEKKPKNHALTCNSIADPHNQCDCGLKPGELETVNDGTTNEEVMRVLIDRLNTMQAKFPCRENAIATTHIETALLWLEKRTADRKARGVEGKHLK